MQNKFYTCKGVRSAKGYGCGELVKQRTLGLGHTCGCYKDWLVNSEKGQEAISKSILKARKEINKKENEKKRNYDKLLTEKIQQIARLIDYGQPCISRGIKCLNNQAGHVLPKQRNTSAKWNLHNIHRQSKDSNYCQEDVKLRKGIEKEYGKEYLNFIDSLKSIPPLNFTMSQKKHAYEISKRVCNELIHDTNIYSLTDRIKIRSEINIRLQIYESSYCVFNY